MSRSTLLWQTVPMLPQVRRSGMSTIRPYTRWLAYRHRGGANEIGLHLSRMFKQLVLGALQAYGL